MPSQILVEKVEEERVSQNNILQKKWDKQLKKTMRWTGRAECLQTMLSQFYETLETQNLKYLV